MALRTDRKTFEAGLQEYTVTTAEAPLDGVPRLDTIYEVPEESLRRWMSKAVQFWPRAHSFLTGCYIQVLRERWRNYSETIKPQATVLYPNPVNARSKSSFFWSTNYTVLRALTSKSIRKQDNHSHW